MLFNNRGNFKKLGLSALLLGGGFLLSKKAIDYLGDKITFSLITRKYDDNLWELTIATQRMTPHVLIENELRSHTNTYIERPIGTKRRFGYWEKILFNMAQLETLPTPDEVEVDTTTVIGPIARKPLVLKIPILIGGMAYGLALTEAYKIAYAKAATRVGTATNTGLGPFLESERKAADKLIIQYPRGSWNKEEKILKQGDAIEIQFGQGANAGKGRTTKAKYINDELRKRLGLKEGQDAVTNNRLNEATNPKDLKSLVEYLRRLTGGVPIGAKIGAGKFLEEDLKILLQAGVDFISIDGAEAGTHKAFPILEDDFGLPTLIALSRAVKFWEKHNLKNKVTLLVGGGLASPGDCLKALALGADAVYLGTAVLIAATHDQIAKVTPFFPPTQLAYETGKY
ncbi:MAG: FMN-binding glutamate synthase family protein, partial [Clostridia bacterium]|nr:FMN-binding glutamate synthase family protein [Clostridia bacterium]